MTVVPYLIMVPWLLHSSDFDWKGKWLLLQNKNRIRQNSHCYYFTISIHEWVSRFSYVMRFSITYNLIQGVFDKCGCGKPTGLFSARGTSYFVSPWHFSWIQSVSSISFWITLNWFKDLFLYMALTHPVQMPLRLLLTMVFTLKAKPVKS